MKSAHFKIQQNGIIRYQSVKAHLEETVIMEQIEKIYKMKETMFVDQVIFINGKKVVRVVKRA